MTRPQGSRGAPATERDDTMGVFTPHAAQESDAGQWLNEALPTDEHLVVRGEHHDDHMPRGWRDLGAYGWFAAALMIVVVGLVLYGFVLPWLGIRDPWQINPLR